MSVVLRIRQILMLPIRAFARLAIEVKDVTQQTDIDDEQDRRGNCRRNYDREIPGQQSLHGKVSIHNWRTMVVATKIRLLRNLSCC
jgi:hypothetical protein